MISRGPFLEAGLNIFSTPGDIISILIVFIIGFFLFYYSARYFQATKVRALLLYSWHTFFCFVYIFATSKIGGDAIWYYTESLIQRYEFSFGTTATLYFTSLLTRGLGLNFTGTFMVFNIIGTYGLIAIDASLRHATKDKSGFVKSLSLLIVLVPSMSYWSAGIAKDTIQFMGTGFLLWSCLDFKKRNIIFLFSLFTIFVVRPHICGIAIFALLTTMMFVKSISFSKKTTYLVIFTFLLIFMLPFAFEYVAFKNTLSIETFTSYINKRQSYNLDGGSSVDIREMNLLYKLFTYLFRPLPLEAHSSLAFLASIDNVLLLTVFTLSILSILFVKKESLF